MEVTIADSIKDIYNLSEECINLVVSNKTA
jgi:hypothetical protein